jgi:hypothetical protein
MKQKNIGGKVMKRYTFLLSVMILILLISGCKSNTIEISDASPTKEESTTTIIENRVKIDGYRIGKGQIAINDDNGDIYYISHTSVNKIENTTGNIINLVEGFYFGKCISLHNDWVYYLKETTLCRIGKLGNDNFAYTLQFPNGIDSIYISDDIIYITTYSNQNIVEYYYADIHYDPMDITFTKGTNEFDLSTFFETAKEHESFIASNYNVSLTPEQVRTIEKSETAVYFHTTDRRFGRLKFKTQEVEFLPIIPYQFEKVTIVSNWIYYNDKSGKAIRTSVDLINTEKLD